MSVLAVFVDAGLLAAVVAAIAEAISAFDISMINLCEFL
jgi:hypothetical protein